jgi:hypothetical protein
MTPDTFEHDWWIFTATSLAECNNGITKNCSLWVNTTTEFKTIKSTKATEYNWSQYWQSARACRLTNLACNAPPYCHLRPLWLRNFFRPYLINGTIFGKKLLNIKCVFWFQQQLLFERFLILRRIRRDIVINVKKSWCKVPFIFVGF